MERHTIEIFPVYPTAQHAAAAQAVTDYFTAQPGVEALLLFGSTARGHASPDSCLDLMALYRPETLAGRRAQIEAGWQRFFESEASFRSVEAVGAYSNVEVDFVDGQFAPGEHGWTSGPDAFELEIGNTLVYSYPLWQGGAYLDELKARWLPYYDDDLRAERLAAARKFCLNNLDHIRLYVERGLYFQSFHRLCNAFYEFMQALFIANRRYPIAYDKWVREQFDEVLGLPELYTQLPRLFEISRFESREMARKANELQALLNEYAAG